MAYIGRCLRRSSGCAWWCDMCPYNRPTAAGKVNFSCSLSGGQLGGADDPYTLEIPVLTQ